MTLQGMDDYLLKEERAADLVEDEHDAEGCTACATLGLLPHDLTTCADFEGGDHCITEHPPETW